MPFCVKVQSRPRASIDFLNMNCQYLSLVGYSGRAARCPDTQAATSRNDCKYGVFPIESGSVK